MKGQKGQDGESGQKQDKNAQWKEIQISWFVNTSRSSCPVKTGSDVAENDRDGKTV